MLFICVRERSIRGLQSPVLEFCILCRAEFGLNSATVPFLHTRQVNGCSENEDLPPPFYSYFILFGLQFADDLMLLYIF